MSTTGEQQRERETQEARDRAVLGMLLSDPTHSPWSIGEISRALPGGENEAIESARWLTEAGLVHRIGEFVWPSLAARSVEQLGV
ncbi:MAG: hypothetical protein ACYCUM_12350 [Solirubrobacteraceae bacterium]